MSTRTTSLELIQDDPQSTAELDTPRMSDGIDREPTDDGNCILFQTVNSNYLFLVTAPAEQGGLLTGGAFGETCVRAFLAGVIPDASDSEGSGRLRMGSRGVFLVESDGCWRRMITSRILKISRTQVRSGDIPATCH